MSGNERLESAPAHQPEIAGIERNIDLGGSGQQTVETMSGGALEGRLAAPAPAHSVDHVRQLARHRLKHRREQFGRVLKVGVDDQHLVAGAKV